MAVAVAQTSMINVALRIPSVDFKRMKGIAKAMGWDIFQTKTQTAADVKAAQEAYVKETLSVALQELKDPRLLDANPETLDDFLNEL